MSESKYSLSEIANDMKAKPEDLKFSALLERIIKAHMIIKEKEYYFPDEIVKTRVNEKGEAVKTRVNEKGNSSSNVFKDFEYIKQRLIFYNQNLNERFPTNIFVGS